jgi:hypothetical protein
MTEYRAILLMLAFNIVLWVLAAIAVAAMLLRA